MQLLKALRNCSTFRRPSQSSSSDTRELFIQFLSVLNLWFILPPPFLRFVLPSETMLRIETIGENVTQSRSTLMDPLLYRQSVNGAIGGKIMEAVGCKK